MKAIGIVRRIDACVIITPRAISPYKYWDFGRIMKKNFWRKMAYFDPYIAKAR